MKKAVFRTVVLIFPLVVLFVLCTSQVSKTTEQCCSWMYPGWPDPYQHWHIVVEWDQKNIPCYACGDYPNQLANIIWSADTGQ